MKKLSMISAAAILAAAASLSFTASAADETVYGTMNIPYTDFYAAELGASSCEVDAVTSATKNKALMNGEGQMFEGSYNNGADTILGVTYPVAISRSDLKALGTEDYGFTALDGKPEAYKTVTVSDGKANFSAVQDAEPETAELGVKLTTETPWGDYLIDLTGQPEGFDTKYRGALLKTADGKIYAMRHEQNIWRGELAWSSGIKTSEPHGNQLDYEMYKGLMGSTVREIVLITKKGYVTISTDTYIPVKFANTLSVKNGDAGSGSTTFAADGLPTDYRKKYAVADGFTVTDGVITYKNQEPGSYNLTVSDDGGKYADITASFVLETDALPVQFKGGKLIAADGFSDADAQNFLKNLASFEIGETRYNASGKGAVNIFDENGAINYDAESRSGKVFADGAEGVYTLKIAATGYRSALVVQLPETSSTAPAPVGTAGETAAESETAAPKTKPAAESSVPEDSGITSPRTADAGIGMLALLASAAVTAVQTRGKRRD